MSNHLRPIFFSPGEQLIAVATGKISLNQLFTGAYSYGSSDKAIPVVQQAIRN